MKKIIISLMFLICLHIVMADNDDTFHTASIGGNNTYFNSWIGNGNLGNFFDKGFMTLQEDIFEDLQWFNNELFRTNTLGGAISHLLLLFSVIGMVTLAEVTINPAFMLMAGLAMFFFGWFVILSVSILLGFFILPISSMYLVRIIGIVKEN